MFPEFYPEMEVKVCDQTKAKVKCAFEGTRRQGRTDFIVRTRELYLVPLTCSRHLRNVDPSLALV